MNVITMRAVVAMKMYWYRSCVVPKMASLVLEWLKVAMMSVKDSDMLLDCTMTGGSGYKNDGMVLDRLLLMVNSGLRPFVK